MTATQRIALVELADGGAAAPERPRRRGWGRAPRRRAAPSTRWTSSGSSTRTPDPDDRRAVRIELTHAGRRLIDERKARASKAFGPAVAALAPADREQLLTLLARMTDALVHLGGA